ASLQCAFNDSRVHQVIKGVVDRSQIWIDFLPHVAGQKSEPFARLNRRPRKDDAVDFFSLKHLEGMCNGEPRFPGACGPGAEYQRVSLERADISILRGSAGTRRTLAQIDFFEGRPWGTGAEAKERALRTGLTDRPLDIALPEVAAAPELLVESLQYSSRLLAGTAGTFNGDMIAALLRHDTKPAFDQREILAILAE